MTAKLIVKCSEHLEAVRAFADQTNQRAQFEQCLIDLTAYLTDLWKVDLYSDFAPYSFFWSQYNMAGQRGLSGGLIYHGQHDGGGNGDTPTFSVNLDFSNGWRIHT
jgi:hypothetical protein